jgi:hypothetical protein
MCLILVKVGAGTRDGDAPMRHGWQSIGLGPGPETEEIFPAEGIAKVKEIWYYDLALFSTSPFYPDNSIAWIKIQKADILGSPNMFFYVPDYFP